MNEEIRASEVVEVTETVELERTTARVSDYVDEGGTDRVRDAVFVAEEPAPPEVATYYAPHGAWDFTESQRIILSFLIWLNILVLTVGYRAYTGHLHL